MSATPTSPGRVLIIAASDSGGGAGIQADIKTVTALGGYATTALTALTAQNTRRIDAVFPVDGAVIEHQIRAVLTDIGAQAIKIGLLPTAPIVRTVGRILAKSAPDIPLIVDPVMRAGCGDRLAQEGVRQALISHLMPMARVCTPNIPEAEILTGQTIRTLSHMRRAARDIRAMGARGVLITGGHGTQSTIHDVLVTERGERVFSGRRIEGGDAHGTGCTLASAIATGLACHLSLDMAVHNARRFVRAALGRAPPFHRGKNRPLGFPASYTFDATGRLRRV